MGSSSKMRAAKAPAIHNERKCRIPTVTLSVLVGMDEVQRSMKYGRINIEIWTLR
jgi:hypothetical protein